MPDREPQIAEAVERLRVLNSQLEIFNTVRRIAFDDAPLPHAAIREIRGLYEAFDQKHPAAKGDQQ